MDNSTTVLIADDHQLVRRGMRTLLDTVPDIEVLGEAATGQETVRLATELVPDVVLMDLQMPDISGIEATRQILEQTPAIRILVITLFDDDDSVFLALRAGARGYVLKDAQEADIIGAIRAVAGGAAIFSPAVANRVLTMFHGLSDRHSGPAFPELTPREREVLEHIAAGKSNQRIARELGLSVKTVGNHVSNIFGKLQVADRAEAIVRAREAGLGRNSSGPVRGG